ncbi:MAG: leucine-rich repeat domain-containing protein [Firmicutes bacterium]|nr:leucine-rich repeat domain-containing protein [Bacillota bacterium]
MKKFYKLVLVTAIFVLSIAVMVACGFNSGNGDITEREWNAFINNTIAQFAFDKENANYEMIMEMGGSELRGIFVDGNQTIEEQLSGSLHNFQRGALISAHCWLENGAVYAIIYDNVLPIGEDYYTYTHYNGAEIVEIIDKNSIKVKFPNKPNNNSLYNDLFVLDGQRVATRHLTSVNDIYHRVLAGSLRGKRDLFELKEGFYTLKQGKSFTVNHSPYYYDKNKSFSLTGVDKYAFKVEDGLITFASYGDNQATVIKYGEKETHDGTKGLNFSPINNGTAYEVSGGTASGNHIKIPSIFKGKPVLGVAINGFKGFLELTKVTFPSGLKTIGANAFQGCKNLKDLELPSGLVTIGANAFRDCISLLEVEIPRGVIEIGANAFKDCIKLITAVLPDTVRDIGDEAFAGCLDLVSVILHDLIKNLGNDLFKNCKSLTRIFVRGTKVPNWGNKWKGEEDREVIVIEDDTDKPIAQRKVTVQLTYERHIYEYLMDWAKDDPDLAKDIEYEYTSFFLQLKVGETITLHYDQELKDLGDKFGVEVLGIRDSFGNFYAFAFGADTKIQIPAVQSMVLYMILEIKEINEPEPPQEPKQPQEVTAEQFEQFIDDTIAHIMDWTKPLQFTAKGYSGSGFYYNDTHNFYQSIVQSTSEHNQDPNDLWVSYIEVDIENNTAKTYYQEGAWYYGEFAFDDISNKQAEFHWINRFVLYLEDVKNNYSYIEYYDGKYRGWVSLGSFTYGFSIVFRGDKVSELLITEPSGYSKYTIGYENTVVTIPENVLDTATKLVTLITEPPIVIPMG